MKEAFIREIALLGEEGFARLAAARVAVFGLGGVGSYAAEALVRAGIGALDFVDGDAVAPSNLNRQLVALTGTIGKNKAEVMAARAWEINPDAQVRAIPRFFTAETAETFDFSGYDFVADCSPARAPQGRARSRAWARGTSSTRTPSALRRSKRRVCARWRGWCARDCATRT